MTEALASNDFDIEKARLTLASNPKVGKTGADQMISAYTVASRALRKKGYSERAIQTGTFISGLSANTAFTREEDYLHDKETGERTDYIGAGNVAATIQRLASGDSNLQAQMYAGAMEATSERPELTPSFSEGFQAIREIDDSARLDPAAREQKIADVSTTLRRTAIRKKGLNVLFGNGHTSRHLAREYQSLVNEKYAQHVQAQQTSASPEVTAKAEDEYMQMIAEMVAAQNNSTNLPLEKRVVVGSLIGHDLGPGVTVQSEANRYRTEEKFQKYVSDFSYLQRQNALKLDPAAAAAAASAQAGAEGAPPPPAANPGGNPFGS